MVTLLLFLLLLTAEVSSVEMEVNDVPVHCSVKVKQLLLRL